MGLADTRTSVAVEQLNWCKRRSPFVKTAPPDGNELCAPVAMTWLPSRRVRVYLIRTETC